MKFKVLSLLFSLFCLGLVSNGQELINTPILRIESGLHAGKLTRISTDAGNRYLVTASDDKTARVWELPSGKLLSILRPPIGEDKDGMLYAVAISPDGETIAVSGWTSNFRNNSIYVFDRESGRIINRIQGLREVVHNLTYSPDGKYFGAILAGRYGVRLYETKNYQLIGEDSDYDGSSFSLDFNPTNTRLVTSSYDGFLRLYEIKDRALNLLKKQKVKNNQKPLGVRFSPDDSKIAVGYHLFTAITVISASDLSILYDVDVSKVFKGTASNPTYFPSIDWSVDGRSIVAAGTNYNKNLEYLISEWTDDGQNYRESLAANGAMFDIVTLQSGDVIFSVANPAGWGILDAERKQVQFITSNVPDFRNSRIGILINDDASQLQFPYERFDKKLTVFSLPERKLEFGKGNEQNLRSNITESKELNIVNWDLGQQPMLNGKKLKLQTNESSYKLSILPNGRQFIIGTSWYLKLFDEQGEMLWKTSLPSMPWILNSSINGKVTAVALGDGTIRWYRISDGQEILAFFSPNDNTGRWILWTPSGYYDASPDAEDLIGWQVNNGRDAAADFFPNHLFKAYFYRPDIIDRILQTADEAQALKIANEKSGRKDEQLTIAKILPPVIEINSPKVKEVTNSTVNLSYNIRSHSGEPVTNFRALIDGKEVSLEKPKITNGISNITIQIPKRDSELSLISENRFTKSLPANIKFRWKNK